MKRKHPARVPTHTLFRAFFRLVLLITGFFLLLSAWQKPAQAQQSCVLKVPVEGAIGAGVSDLLERAEAKAKEKGCGAILMTINTPGGSLQTTRLIVERILASEVPYLCLVAPAGGHAGSAGAIILQACHVSGAMEATNLGAATPVVGTGEELKGDMRQKLVNDTVSWTVGLAKLRGRSEQFAKDIVEKGKAVEAGEAKRLGAIDVIASSIEDFLKQAEGRLVKMPESKEAKVTVGPIVEYQKDVRSKFLDFIADPQIAYLLFMGSLALLYFEITNPGTMVPGVLGALGLILSLIAFHMLDVQWGGLALMALGLALLVAEAFIPSFGILGVGGIVAFIFGGILLFDGEAGGLALSLQMILPTAIGVGGGMLFMGYLIGKALKKKKSAGLDLLIQESAEVSWVDPHDSKRGQVFLQGETWNFECSESVSLGERVVVLDAIGLTLKVKKKES